MPLYHAEIGIPRGLPLPCGEYRLEYSEHATREARKDGLRNLPEWLNTAAATLIELEIEYGQRRPCKLLYRIPFLAYDDLVLAVIPRNGRLFVKTVWLNNRFDNHGTLRKEKYATVS